MEAFLLVILIVCLLSSLPQLLCMGLLALCLAWSRVWRWLTEDWGSR